MYSMFEAERLRGLDWTLCRCLKNCFNFHSEAPEVAFPCQSDLLHCNKTCRFTKKSKLYWERGLKTFIAKNSLHWSSLRWGNMYSMNHPLNTLNTPSPPPPSTTLTTPPLAPSPHLSVVQRYTHSDKLCTVGWSDLAFYFDFRKPTHFCWWGIFLRTQFQRLSISAERAC